MRLVKIQVLVAAMHQTDYSLINKMNISTDAIIGNQCDLCSDQIYQKQDCRILYLNRTDRGVGQNRNVALSHSDAEIITFADEDMRFVDNYQILINQAFTELPEADAIIFNTTTNISNNKNREIKKIRRVRVFNAFNYGATRLSVRAGAVKRENIMFHSCFGGGTRYGCGEDTLFIADLLRRGLRIYTYPVSIADVDQTKSTWFHGYDKKYLHDKGALFAAISYRWARLLCLQDLIRHQWIYKDSGLSFFEAYSVMKEGIVSFRTLRPFDSIGK